MSFLSDDLLFRRLCVRMNLKINHITTYTTDIYNLSTVCAVGVVEKGPSERSLVQYQPRKMGENKKS